MPASKQLRATPEGPDAPLQARLARHPPGRRVGLVMAATYLALTAVFVLLGKLVVAAGDEGVQGRFDRPVATWLEDHRVDALDTVSETLTGITEPFTVIGVVIAAVVVLTLLRRWPEATVLLVAVPLELATYLSVVAVVDRARPEVEPLGSVPFTASFPSGHVAAAVAVYGGLVVVVRTLSTSTRVDRGAVVVAALLVVAVSFSRMYNGLHHASDVVAGLAVGGVALAAAVVAARSVPAEVPTGDP